MGINRAVSTRWELDLSFLLLGLVGLVPLVICPSGNISLAVIQCLALEGYGMSQSFVTPAYIHTLNHAFTVSKQKEVSVCSSPCSFFWNIWMGSSKKFRIWKLYFPVLLHIYIFFCRLNTESWLSFNLHHYVLELLISPENHKWAA